MKRIISAAAMLAAMSTISMAADQTITLGASVDPFCSISGAANTTVTVNVGATTGLTTGTSTAPTMNVVCNNKAAVSLTSAKGAVTLNGAAESALSSVSNFRNKIEYTAAINGGATAGAVTLDTSSTSTISGQFSDGPVSATGTQITITPETSTIPLVAGSYSDTLTVSILPN